MSALRHRAFVERPTEGDLQLVTDRWGCKMWLHPYYHIDHEIITKGTYARSLHVFLERTIRPGMVVMDVGANIGSVTLHLSKLVGALGRVISFEPVPALVARLEQNLSVNPGTSNVTIEATAVSDYNGEGRIDIDSVTSRNHGRAKIVGAEGPGQTRIVRCVTIDGYVSKHRLTRLDLIKFDIQGAEVRALEGALNVLREFRPVVLTEVSPQDLRATGSNSRSYMRRWEELGYTCMKTSTGSGRLTRVDSSTVDENVYFSNLICLPR